MNNTLGLISSFLGGAIVGAGAALLFAPEKGEDLRSRIADILRRKGLCCCDCEVDTLVEQVTTEGKAPTCD